MSQKKENLQENLKLVEKRCGVVRFLQLNPQSRGVEAVLNLNYGNDVKTISEWKEILNNLLNRKMR